MATERINYNQLSPEKQVELIRGLEAIPLPFGTIQSVMGEINPHVYDDPFDPIYKPWVCPKSIKPVIEQLLKDI